MSPTRGRTEVPVQAARLVSSLAGKARCVAALFADLGLDTWQAAPCCLEQRSCAHHRPSHARLSCAPVREGMMMDVLVETRAHSAMACRRLSFDSSNYPKLANVAI